MAAPELLEQLAERVESLERRVLQLEQSSVTAERPTARPQRPLERATQEAWQFGPAVTATGIALLGIAGAYVLRALAGAAVSARPALGVAGAAYAMGWAVAAARTPRRFAGGLYASTSVLILGPMLWEMCLGFRAMSPIVAAVILAASVVVLCVTTRRDYDAPAFSVVFAGSAVTALALCVGTRNMVPFVSILLGMALFDVVHRKRLGGLLTAFVLVAADAGVWALLWVYRAPIAARPEYPALPTAVILAAPLCLFLLQAVTIALRAFRERQKISAFDAVQTMASFGFLAAGVFWIAPSFAASLIGSFCLVLCAACYWAAFHPLHRGAEPRNFRLFATFAVLLLAWGLYLVMPLPGAAVAFALGPVAAMLAAQRFQSTILEAHAVVYLVLAAFACGMPVYEWHMMLADAPRFPAGTLLVAAALGIAAYAVCREQIAEDARHQLIHFAFALLAACTACALVTHALLAGASMAVSLEGFHVAVVRTLAICAVALGLIVGGARLQRPSMSRVAYVLLGFVVLKLVFEDLRHGHLGYLAASISMVAVTLIVVPRVATHGERVVG